MGALFGKPKKQESRVTDQDRAILELKKQRDKLKQYQKKIFVQLEKERQVAKQLLNDGKKDKAKLLLRKKKFQEEMITKTDKQLDNIDKMVNDIEFAEIEAKVVNGLKQGNDALKKMHELMSIEDVEKIMDDTQASIEYQNEIDALLAGGLSAQDEEDVENELDELLKQSLPSVPNEKMDINLPDVPSEKIQDAPAKERRKEAAMAS